MAATVVYGWSQDLKQWHMTAIIPDNFTKEQTQRLVNIAVASTELACGRSHSEYNEPNEKVLVFIDGRPDNRNLKTAVYKAKKMLEVGDAVEAVSAIEMALFLPMGEHTRSTLYKARDEANIGSPEQAEILLDLIAMDLEKV